MKKKLLSALLCVAMVSTVLTGCGGAATQEAATEDAAAEETGEATAMYSGPLHDAAEMAKILPSIMMFVKSTAGLSHCKEEDTPDSDLETGISAFLRLADKVIQE